MKNLVLALGLCLATAVGIAAETGAPAGKVKRAEGSVTIDRAGHVQSLPVGSTVYVGDRIRTGADGSVGITLFDDTLLTAGPRSTLLINQFQFNPATNEGNLLTTLVKVPIIDNSVVKYQRLKIPYRSLPWTVLILSGVLLSVIDYSQQLNGIAHLGLSLISLLIAAISYPLGNRKVMAVNPEVNGVEKVFGMLICSYPTWLILATISYFKVGAPTVGMLENTFSVALSSGVVATVLFFQATSMVAKHMPSLAKVEATQSMEVVFSVLLSVLFLGHAIPGGWQLAGLIIMVIGIIGISLR